MNTVELIDAYVYRYEKIAYTTLCNTQRLLYELHAMLQKNANISQSKRQAHVNMHITGIKYNM